MRLFHGVVFKQGTVRIELVHSVCIPAPETASLFKSRIRKDVPGREERNMCGVRFPEIDSENRRLDGDAAFQRGTLAEINRDPPFLRRDHKFERAVVDPVFRIDMSFFGDVRVQIGNVNDDVPGGILGIITDNSGNFCSDGCVAQGFPIRLFELFSSDPDRFSPVVMQCDVKQRVDIPCKFQFSVRQGTHSADEFGAFALPVLIWFDVSDGIVLFITSDSAWIAGNILVWRAPLHAGKCTAP